MADLPLLPDERLPRVPARPPHPKVPPTYALRQQLREQVERYVTARRWVPPIPFADLRRHAEEFLATQGASGQFRDYCAVLINNEIWRDQLAAVPYQRRLLLLPKCLRHESKCPAPFDEFGLLCQQCGLCTIQDLQGTAERLGYAVLVAEGSALVTSIIQTGKIDAIVGISCLNVLEKAFPFMEAAAIPGMAVPLLQSDCRSTSLDLDWAWDTIHLTSEDKTRRLDLEALRREVDSWFAPEALRQIMGEPAGHAEQLAQGWLTKAGKRWRPYLAACVYKALCDGPIPDDFRKIAVAVECFHKASLIHDDIEDDDATRYGEPTLHAQAGVPVALNVGDLLIGEGYRLLGLCAVDPACKAGLFRVAAEGHRALCLGQGAELAWSRQRGPLASRAVLEIFGQKTAPAFAVALQLGALYAGAGPEVLEVLGRYCEALGIAYQIRDDLDDFVGGSDPADILAQRPTLPLALAHEEARGQDKLLLEALWRGTLDAADQRPRLQSLLTQLAVESRARDLYDAYRSEAIRSLQALEHASLKGLLRRVVARVLADVQQPGPHVEGWCREFERGEFEARDAADGTPGAQAAG